MMLSHSIITKNNSFVQYSIESETLFKNNENTFLLKLEKTGINNIIY